MQVMVVGGGGSVLFLFGVLFFKPCYHNVPRHTCGSQQIGCFFSSL